ncbi:MAG: SAM-dependent methyltransferase [Candidatus Hodarchaeales archaeon]|jgi:uncharacterized protein YabN with tetrapyrrole methylase and pyrophosphatase domain
MLELIVVGTGISVGHLTIEAISEIESADKLIYLVPDPITEKKLLDLNKTGESLHTFYVVGKERIEIYNEMVDHILSFLTDQKDDFSLCVAFYGHPGVYTYPSHKAIEIAREMGIEAKMLPGISAEDCLYADLGIDPGEKGSQSFEATHFLESKINFNPDVNLILWQIGILGNSDYQFKPKKRTIEELKDYLLKYYSKDHKIILYEAATHKIFNSKVLETEIKDLDKIEIDPLMTLCVLP